MKFSKLTGLLLLAGALGPLGCNTDPESFCEAKVTEVCGVLAGCCSGSADFDREGCELQLSSSCEDALEVEGVHSGEYVFDAGSAAACYGTIASCGDVLDPADPSLDVVRACGNMLTGHRPPGAACESSAQCERAGGDYPACHGNAICAKVILSEDDCGFSFVTNELRVCVPGKYCKSSGEIDPTDPPSVQDLEFTGSCTSYVGKGGPCVAGNTQLPCADGLYCDLDFMNPDASTCQSLKGEGQACEGNDCEAGLTCDFNGATAVCAGVAAQGPFCYVPPECGNGTCEDGEDLASCAADCNTCGNGLCDPGEASTCAEDCCGDGLCSFNDGEPATCPDDCCGDGFCDPGETPQICALDCGP